MGHETWFDVIGHGYEVPKDGFGYRGVRLKPEPGQTLKVGTPRVMASLPPGIIAINPMPDRQKWLALVPENAGVGTVTVVQNWMAGLKK